MRRADASTAEVILRGNVSTTQCCNGGTTKSSISQKHKRARETTNRTSKKRMRDGQRKRHRWLLKCVRALV